MTPYEIIMAPYEIFIAPAIEAFPDVDTTPAGNWVKLGTNGKHNLSEDGVTVTHEQTLSFHRTLGSTGPVKAARPEEGLLIAGILEDLTAEQYGKILNGVIADDVAAASGTPGHRDITLRQGHAVTEFSLLVKGPSAYGDSFASQYQIPRVVQNGNPAPVFTKGEASGLAFEFVALEDAAAATEAERFGKLVVQDEVAGA